MSMVLLNEVELMNTIERVRNYSRGLSTGFADLDYVISGLQRGNLYILGGRPSMGKTMLAMNMIYSIAVNQKKSVLFVSLDQSKARIVPKLLQINNCTFRINGAPFPRQWCKRLALAVRYPFVVTC